MWWVVVVVVVGGGGGGGGLNMILVFCFGQTFFLKTLGLDLDQAEQYNPYTYCLDCVHHLHKIYRSPSV